MDKEIEVAIKNFSKAVTGATLVAGADAAYQMWQNTAPVVQAQNPDCRVNIGIIANRYEDRGGERTPDGRARYQPGIDRDLGPAANLPIEVRAGTTTVNQVTNSEGRTPPISVIGPSNSRDSEGRDSIRISYIARGYPESNGDAPCGFDVTLRANLQELGLDLLTPTGTRTPIPSGTGIPTGIPTRTPSPSPSPSPSASPDRGAASSEGFERTSPTPTKPATETPTLRPTDRPTERPRNTNTPTEAPKPPTETSRSVDTPRPANTPAPEAPTSRPQTAPERQPIESDDPRNIPFLGGILRAFGDSASEFGKFIHDLPIPLVAFIGDTPLRFYFAAVVAGLIVPWTRRFTRRYLIGGPIRWTRRGVRWAWDRRDRARDTIVNLWNSRPRRGGPGGGPAGGGPAPVPGPDIDDLL